MRRDESGEASKHAGAEERGHERRGGRMNLQHVMGRTDGNAEMILLTENSIPRAVILILSLRARRPARCVSRGGGTAEGLSHSKADGWAPTSDPIESRE